MSESDHPPAKPKHDPLEALRQPAFAFYSGSRIFSSLGQQLLQAVMAWQVYEITGSALSLGLLGLARFIPALNVTRNEIDEMISILADSLLKLPHPGGQDDHVD